MSIRKFALEMPKREKQNSLHNREDHQKDLIQSLFFFSLKKSNSTARIRKKANCSIAQVKSPRERENEKAKKNKKRRRRRESSVSKSFLRNEQFVHSKGANRSDEKGTFSDVRSRPVSQKQGPPTKKKKVREKEIIKEREKKKKRRKRRDNSHREERVNSPKNFSQ